MGQDGRSRAQRLRDGLEEAIINGELLPGARLDPEALASRYGCSRTPIREAIQQLAASGLVTVVPKRGTFVAELGITELVERFEVMAELEGMCGRLAARRISPAEAAALQQALEACGAAAASDDADAYYYENERFHHLIYAASHNGFLEREARRLHARLKPYRRLQLRLRNRVARSYAEHEAVVAAILDGDGSAAEAALKAHVLVQGERFSDFVASVHALTGDRRSAGGSATT
ncbi:GntR family transcriptional regulator [Spiribacter halobius]|uniref:GntR family transcriptional regulator n=1 Tax=Sediminicurvatus halobius TaxID=2182432 RepID=A0A2U2MYZ3_9GAMM|nr:GntR family transcriptional regulator [Spiribacter halobius]PWG62038.1 GntR family transcriptional regulator [Spiribacter halobius]UEX78699.1 GntR family transcriptional regulator [Spiribacter halobius]